MCSEGQDNVSPLLLWNHCSHGYSQNGNSTITKIVLPFLAVVLSVDIHLRETGDIGESGQTGKVLRTPKIPEILVNDSTR